MKSHQHYIILHPSGRFQWPGINERIAKLLPDGAVMPHNSEMVMFSVDCDPPQNMAYTKGNGNFAGENDDKT